MTVDLSYGTDGSVWVMSTPVSILLAGEYKHGWVTLDEARSAAGTLSAWKDAYRLACALRDTSPYFILAILNPTPAHVAACVPLLANAAAERTAAEMAPDWTGSLDELVATAIALANS